MVKDTKKKEQGCYISFVARIDGIGQSEGDKPKLLDTLIKNGYLIRKVVRTQSLRSSQDLNKDLGITKEYTTYEVYEKIEEE